MQDSHTISAARGHLQVQDTRLSYLDWGGSGPPALLLHGITSSAATLWRVGPALAAAGLRPIALDMPGHGESDTSRAHAINTIAGLVGDTIIALGLHEVTLLGHSWGGATALALAGGSHPARDAIARAVLVDPALAIETGWGEEALPSYVEGVGEPATAGAAAIRAKNPAWDEGDVYWKAIAMEQCRREQVMGFFQPPADWDLLGRIAHVAVPLLVMVAAPGYSVIPEGRLAEVRAALTPGRDELVVVPGTTHNMFRGPGYERTMAALLRWLAG
ncbi:MAG: alpha/beta hydrolase [Chloroflexales bacterium]|nr:alpha/beta hydrolase [Chloroflexales bacterium]